ncbi:cyanophycinase [Frigoriglobus tundricola]|uniref:Cyanophycinase n=1 Tax=Frigoriglobus tundricola TaxID=2774151 RepID=A0A6M5YTX8_9BACT|nr:cyanophycinase [Frigoriglobus tundricola]QJW96876.1 Cyanophycinase dimer [Frigoriglobus tundricola]
MWLRVVLFVCVFGTPRLPAADPLPAPLDPRGLPGPLVIAGDAKTPPTDVRDAFFGLAGKDKAKIVVVSSDKKRGGGVLDVWQELKPLSADLLETADRKTADDPAFVKPLTEATAVWLADGDAERFGKVYAGTAVEKELKKLHARGRVVGAAAPLSAWLGDRAGLALLPGFAIGTQKQTDAVLKNHPACVGLSFGSDAAVVIRGRVARVIGDSPVTVHVGKGAGKAAADDEYKAGALLDLVQLQRAALNRAAQTPFPAAKPPAAVVSKGALVIVGGGGAGPEIWKKFIDLAGGPDSTIVVVTTAMEDPLAPESVEEKTLKKFGAKNVVALHTRDRAEANAPKFSEVLTKAKGVWFSGGRQWRFVDAYEGTLTEKRFREVLARGGVIGGSSAGASIQSEYMPRGHPLGNTVVAAEGYERGFGFLPGCAVDQHFFARKRTADMTGLMKEYPQYLGIGLDEGTAIVVTGSTAEVIGKSKVAFYDTKKKPDGDKDYEEVFPNEKYDLKERRKLK